MRTPMRASLVFCVLGWGCSDFATKAGQDNEGSTSADGGDTDTDETDTGIPQDLGVYWALDADLSVVDGGIDLDGSEIRLRRLRNLAESCLDQVSLSSAEAVEPLPHETIWSWWEVDWPVDDLNCFPEGQGAANLPLRVGFGLLHPEIVAALPSSSLVAAPEGTAGLLGAYLQLADDDRLLVFGAAGSEAAWAGSGTDAEPGVVGDGVWWLRSVYSLPLTW